MKKYNYFDDDNDSINSILSSFDAPREEKEEEIGKSLKEIETSRLEQRKALKAEQRKERINNLKSMPIKKDVLNSIKSFSKKSGEKIATVASSVKEKSFSEEIEKLSRNKKRRVTIILLCVFFLAFAILIFATLHSVNSENKRIAKFDADAGKVCAQYITKYGSCSYEYLYSEYGVNGYRMNGLSYVREIDFNNDNISELLVCYDDGGTYYTEVWGYNADKEFINLYHEKATQTGKKADDAWITIYCKNNKYYIGAHSGVFFEDVDLYAFKGDSFEKKHTAKYDAVAEAFSMKGKVDSTSFERIKLSVLVEVKAIVTAEQVTKAVDSFLGTNGSAQYLSNSQSLQNAYYSVVSEYNQTYGKAKLVKDKGITYIDGLAAVDLVDFNGDDKNELVLIYRKEVKTRDSDAQGNYISKIEDKYYIEVYRYNGTKAVLAYKNESISNSLNDSDDMYYIIKKKNKSAYYCVNSFSTQERGNITNAISTIFKFDGTQLVQQSQFVYQTKYGYTHYYIDDEEVYRSTFNKKGYSVPLFNGKNSYDDNVYTVTYLQRNPLKAGNMQKRVNDTISTIRKLNSSYSGDTE